MTTRSDFDDIRPYNDSELTTVLERMVSDKEVLAGIAMVMPKQLADKLVLGYKELRSVDQFQEEYMYPMLEHLKDIKSTAITYSGSEYVKQPALFLSNHRDIIIDPAFLQYVLLKCGMKTSEIAIGSNLMAKPWITDAMRVNKSFVVRRNLTRGEQISAFGELSRYIAHTITQKRASIWLAQREGRAKDSDDRTQISLLKMLSLSGEGSFAENIKKLRLHPLSISYEYDVCRRRTEYASRGYGGCLGDTLRLYSINRRGARPNRLETIATQRRGTPSCRSDRHKDTSCVQNIQDKLYSIRPRRGRLPFRR